MFSIAFLTRHSWKRNGEGDFRGLFTFFCSSASLDSDFLRRLTPLSYLNVSLKDYITDRLLPPPGLVPFLWACFRQVLGDVCQTVSFFSYLLQALFKILQLFLLIVRITVEPLNLSGERWTLHSTLENTKTGCRLIQNAIIVLQHHISICSHQWEKSMILRLLLEEYCCSIF